MKPSVSSQGWSGPMSMARSLVICPPSTVEMMTFSKVSAKCLTSGVLSRSARCFRPPVHAKMEAIGLVEVF